MNQTVTAVLKEVDLVVKSCSSCSYSEEEKFATGKGAAA